MFNQGIFTEAYDAMTEANGDVTITITDTPDTSDYNVYEGKWSINKTPQTMDQIKSLIMDKIFGKGVRPKGKTGPSKINLFDNTGKHTSEKKFVFKSSGIWSASYKQA